jgi:hypothetical protein
VRGALVALALAAATAGCYRPWPGSTELAVVPPEQRRRAGAETSLPVGGGYAVRLPADGWLETSPWPRYLVDPTSGAALRFERVWFGSETYVVFPFVFTGTPWPTHRWAEDLEPVAEPQRPGRFLEMWLGRTLRRGRHDPRDDLAIAYPLHAVATGRSGAGARLCALRADPRDQAIAVESRPAGERVWPSASARTVCEAKGTRHRFESLVDLARFETLRPGPRHHSLTEFVTWRFAGAQAHIPADLDPARRAALRDLFGRALATLAQAGR